MSSSWILAVMTGLSLLPELIGAYSLPAVVGVFQGHPHMTGYIFAGYASYLMALAAGTFFWGIFSEIWGYKRCVIGGVLFFLIGELGCIFSEAAVGFRVLEGFGASAGVIIGHIMAYKAFKGAISRKIFALLCTTITVFPALALFLVELHSPWEQGEVLSVIFGLGLGILLLVEWPQHYSFHQRSTLPLGTLMHQILTDRTALSASLMAAICQGMCFSFYAEGPFLFKGLGFSLSQYYDTFFLLALGALLGGGLVRYWHGSLSLVSILRRGTGVIVLTNFMLIAFLLSSERLGVGRKGVASMLVFSQACNETGKVLIMSVTLSLIIRKYRQHAAVAFSLLGFLYTLVMAVIAWGMGGLHNGEVWPMPFYFGFLSLAMMGIYRGLKLPLKAKL